MAEFVKVFELLLQSHGLAATFWGSARTTPSDEYYKAEALAAKLAKKGFDYFWWWPRIMEASKCWRL